MKKTWYFNLDSFLEIGLIYLFGTFIVASWLLCTGLSLLFNWGIVEFIFPEPFTTSQGSFILAILIGTFLLVSFVAKLKLPSKDDEVFVDDEEIIIDIVDIFYAVYYALLMVALALNCYFCLYGALAH